MARDASGNYSLPVGNPVVTGTVIASTWANTTMSDIGSELTNSLDRNGRGGMLAPLRIEDGTKAVPGIGFTLEVNAGIYRVGSGQWGFSVGSAGLLELLSSGVGSNPEVRVAEAAFAIRGSTGGVLPVVEMFDSDGAANQVRFQQFWSGPLHVSRGVADNGTAYDANITQRSDGGVAIGTPTNSAPTTRGALNLEEIRINDVKATLVAPEPRFSRANEILAFNNATFPTFFIDIATGPMWLYNDSNPNDIIRVNSVSTNVGTNVSGVGGIDTGSAANSTWYFYYIIYNPSTTTTAALFSLSATAPTLPSGYTHKALIGAVYNDASGDLINIRQTGFRVACDTVSFALPHSATLALVGLSTAVPPHYVSGVGGSISMDNTLNAGETLVVQPTTDAGLGSVKTQNPIAGTPILMPFSSPLYVSQQLQYMTTQTSGVSVGALEISSWEFRL